MKVYYHANNEKIGHYYRDKYCQFECLNELKNIHDRSYSNILCMNRFLFECDNVDKEVQLQRAMKLFNDKVAQRVVDSANKSIHVIIQVADMNSCRDVDRYKILWHYLNRKFFNSEADTQCQNPNRLTRTPNAVRFSTNKIQQCYACSNTEYVLTEEDRQAIEADWQKHLEYKAKIIKSVTSNPLNALLNKNKCLHWEVVQRYLKTPFLKMTGNKVSSKWLFAAVKTCQQHNDDATLQLVLDKARRERWSEIELSRILRS